MSDATTAVKDTNFASGAVRSAERNHLDFTSLPLVGLIGLSATAAEGGTKYGRFNYMRGMPAHDLINHVFGHIVLFLLGDRKEPHLEHAGWGVLAAIQSITLDPELSEPHLLGPGATLTPAMLAFMAANAPELAAKRASGEFSGIGGWDLSSLPEIESLLADREIVKASFKAEPVVRAEVLLAEAMVTDAMVDEVVAVVAEKKKRRTKVEMARARAAEAAPVVEATPVAEPAVETLDAEDAAMLDAPVEDDSASV